MADSEIERVIKRMDARLERVDAGLEARREFMRELTLRHERADRVVGRRLRAIERKTDEMVASLAAETRALDDLVEESRAQRQALFRMLDAPGGGGAAPATG